MILPSLEELKKDYGDILNQLSDPGLISNWSKFEELSRKKSQYEKIMAKLEELKEIEKETEENKAISASSEDHELVILAEGELKILKNRRDRLQKETEELFSGSESEGEDKHSGSVLIEIRAGVGGEESALFAAALFRMYSKYAQSKAWKQKVLDERATELGGYKEVIFELQGPGVLKEMRHEGGVHRVQRIPDTEKSGRVHTSTCSVAVLPRPQKSEIKIKPEDLKIELYRASGPGGQNVNRRETAVRITHLPSGMAVSSQTERSQLQNKENAMAILEARILDFTLEREEEQLHGKRKAQIKWAKRSEKIRTYNFPQDRVTDHRIKKSWHGIDAIMEGRIAPILLTLQKEKNS